MPQRATHGQGQTQKQRQATGQGQCHCQAIAPIQRAQGLRPGMVFVGLHTHARHGLRYVHRELVGRRVLAGMQAGAAVVAQIGQVVHVGHAELESARHRGKHRAKGFAIAAGIADLHLPRHLGHFRRGLAIGQGARLLRQGFNRLHQAISFITCLLNAAAAACVPAMRPKAVPMVMPTPAV